MAEYVCPSGHVVIYDDDVTLPGKLSIGSHGYAQVTRVVPGTVVLFHRWVLGLEIGDERIADHINRDRLDCRRVNLRVVTARENNYNRPPRKNGLPKGVHLSRNGERYHARQLGARGAPYLGAFDTIEEALEAQRSAGLAT